ncbi:metallophosphoesterase family protein [Candidatus Leptofilum sp.]|uniref:metallophosphoesterase family protein n=1 Tax=Candidatus Leptofilum sp. TaxID=3241576 RepID=UPI003B5CC209
MTAPISFHTAEQSVFQSAFLEVLADEIAQQDDLEKSVFDAAGLGLKAEDDTMQTLANVLDPHAKGGGDLFSTMGVCVQHTLDLAKAKALGRDDEVERLQNILTASLCDAINWAKIASVAAGYYKLSGNKPVYRKPARREDFVYPLPEGKGETLTIGLIADWGSGERVAELVFEEMCLHKPDVVIHLGDVYYSGTGKEQAENFTNIVNRIREDYPCVLYNLPGNHDYYAGGAAFYDELARLNQPPAAPAGTPQQEASFFCLRNDHWQIHGLDTGYHDHDYFKHAVDNARLVLQDIGADHETHLTDEELAWHLDKLENRGDRRVIFLSHHQLFSAYLKVGKDYINQHLQEQFADALKTRMIDAWFWGHEHVLQVYADQFGLAKGRCVGYGAFPILAQENPYEVEEKTGVKLYDKDVEPGQRIELVADERSGVYEHGYVILKLKPPNQPSEAIYYTVPGDGSEAISTEIFRETL